MHIHTYICLGRAEQAEGRGEEQPGELLLRDAEHHE